MRTAILLMAAIMSASSTAADALGTGCYPAETVRAQVWKAAQDKQQYTILLAHTAEPENRIFLVTTTLDGREGYLLLRDTKDSPKICVISRIVDIAVSRSNRLSARFNPPLNSENHRIYSQYYTGRGAAIAITARGLVNRNGQEYYAKEVAVLLAGLSDKGENGIVLVNDLIGSGGVLARLSGATPNPGYDKFVRSDVGPLPSAAESASINIAALNRAVRKLSLADGDVDRACNRLATASTVPDQAYGLMACRKLSLGKEWLRLPSAEGARTNGVNLATHEYMVKNMDQTIGEAISSGGIKRIDAASYREYIILQAVKVSGEKEDYANSRLIP